MGNATLWRCQESTCSPSSHKSFAPQNLCGSPERGSSHHLLASRVAARRICERLPYSNRCAFLRLRLLFPQIFCSAKSLREPYKGGAARPHVRARGGRLRLDFSGSFPIKAVLFFRQNPQAPFFRSLKTASSFPEEGDDVQCVKRGEGPPKKLPRRARQEVGITSSLVAVKRGGPPKKNIPAPSSERGGTTPAPENNKKTAPPRGRTEEGFICQIQL